MTEANEIMMAIEAAGFKAFIVGGAVRDRLLGLPVNDFDLSTDATPDELLEALPGAREIHSRAKAPVVIFRGHEIASFRSETGSRQEAVFAHATMEEDAHRRDFTVNALFEDRHGKVFDPTGMGLKDLKRKLVTFIGNGVERIEEDPTRVLRAFRLSASKGFRLGRQTMDSLRSGVPALERLAVEQVGRELRRLLVVEDASQVVQAFRAMAKLGVLKVILPEVDACRGVEQNHHHQEGDVFEHTMLVLSHTKASLTLRMAALLHDIGKVPTQKLNDRAEFSFIGHDEVGAEMADKILRRLNVFNRAEREEIVFLVANHMRAHALGEMNRGKQALLLRHGASELLLELLLADCHGRLPVRLESLEASFRAAKEFWAVDRVLSDLGINGDTVLELQRQKEADALAAGEEVKPLTGRVVGEKLKMMSAVLNKHPHKSREELLQTVGFCR
jgi:tRNA nucleotidyltransferase (CCA-adding enzyme)